MHVYACECTYRHVNGVQEVASSNLAAPIAENVELTGYLWVRSLTGFGPAATLGCYISVTVGDTEPLADRETAASTPA
jgi:hypothetical protein